MPREQTDKIIEWAMRITTPIVVAALVWLASILWALQTSVTVIESTYYTLSDARIDQRAHDKTITEIRSMISEVDKKLTDLPHLSRQIDQLSEELRRMNNRHNGGGP